MYQDINFTNNHYPSNVVSKLKSIPSSLLVLPHNDQAYVLYDKHTDARLVSVCVSTLYTLHIGAVSSVRGVLRTTGLGPGQGGGAETRRGPTTLLPSSNLSHPTTCPILHSTVHLEYHSAPPPLLCCCSPPSPRTTQLGDTVNCNQRCRS